jgi:hypothetical protein
MVNTTKTKQQGGAGSTGGKSLTMSEFEQLCDDPARDLPGGTNMRAVLALVPERGFFLSAQDGDEMYQVTDDAGKPMKFRTIEGALAALQNISGLSPDIGVYQDFTSGSRH